MERDDSFWCLLPTPPPPFFFPFPTCSLSFPTPSTPPAAFLSIYPSFLSSPILPLLLFCPLLIQRISLFRAAFPFKVEENGHVSACVCVCGKWEWFSFMVLLKEVMVTHLQPQTTTHTHHSYTPCTPSSPPSLWCVFEPIANQVASGLVLISPSHQPH